MTTENSAPVVIGNASSRTFRTIGVSHKYSDVYKNQASWNQLAPGPVSSPPLTVQHNTGFGTTGQDWWWIVAVDDQNNGFQTDPSNGRGFWDAVEDSAGDIGDALTELCEALAPETEGVGLVGAAVTTALTAALNSESTAGFKEFLLREGDAAQGVTITVTDDDVTFSADSGTAETPLVALQQPPVTTG
jgi:hypothetical protein